MRIVDVCAFYTPSGGGVRTYIDAKLRAASRFGHEMIVIAPGDRREVRQVGPGAIVATLPGPTLPVDRRYRYFDDECALHDMLDEWRPDHVEASSPWSSAAMVGRWRGPATRSLVMHSDPLSSYAYRWLDGVAGRPTIDRWFGRFWRHLRGLDAMFDLVVSANSGLTDRLRGGGLRKAETLPMGVERGVFSPEHRSESLRRSALRSLGLDESAILMLGVGRFSAEKRWSMVIDAAGRVPPGSAGLMLAGDGPRRRRLEAQAARRPSVKILPPIADRRELARLMASADVLVHGCESETFCMVAAEARASGIPLIVPDRGAARDQLIPAAGLTYRSASGLSLARAIQRFIDRGPQLQRARAVRNSRVRTMDQHFGELFNRYSMLALSGPVEPASASPSGRDGGDMVQGRLAVSRLAAEPSY